MKREMKNNSINWFKAILLVSGVVFLFVGIWADRWNILRWLITSIILFLWGHSIKWEYERKRK